MKMYKRLLLLSILLLFISKIFAQSSFEVKGEIGFLDLANTGVKYNTKMGSELIGIGLNVGIYDPFVEKKYGVLTIEPCIYYHFNFNSDFSERKPWYLKNGVTWFAPYPNEKHLYYSLRFGSEIYFTEHVGISLYIGGYIELWTNFHSYFMNFPIFPGLGIYFFCKI